MRLGRLLLPLALLAVLLSAEAPGQEKRMKPTFDTRRVRTGFPLAECRVVDTDGKAGAELLAVGAAGEVRVWRHDAESGGPSAIGAGTLVLPHPDRTLLATADLAGRGGPLDLAALSPAGLTIYRMGEDGGFSGPGEKLSARTRFRLRLLHPRFARFLRDINDDGLPDLLLPGGETSEVWINAGAGEDGKGRPRLRRAAAVRTDLQRYRTTEGEALSDRLESAFRIPYLTFQDVNGDRRPDLLVIEEKTRAFHLQREDGSVPPEPDIVLDLRIFRDTTPAASVRPGHTLAGGEDASVEVQDLDGDSVPDYVVSHRRKIWIFHGSERGPQFTEPSAILKVAEDVSQLLVIPLDDDEYPDLMLVRLQVPTIATLLKGLYSEWEVEANAVGYRNEGGRKFERTPSWKGTVRLRLPEIVGSLRNPEALFRKFE
ncbi:MAG: FG-GAP repeat domain-containing protein, partial [Planctomycetota bacterium]